MKKLTLLVMFVSLVATGSVFAQDNGFDFGVKGGLNLSTAWGGDSEIGGKKPQFAPKFAAGVFFQKEITDMISVGADLMFSLKGANYDISPDKVESTLSYIELPIYAAIEPIDKLQIIAGPYLGYLVAAESKVDDKKTDTKDNAANFDLGVTLGASYEVVENLTVEGRYSLGLLKTDKDGNLDIKNMNIQFLVGYAFL